ncbi:MAG: ATP-binding cassette domain-containing protein [Bacteroidia bacterium]|nr:ATP-binding cassette domain-containing protein [Bacteroidia bacterium]
MIRLNGISKTFHQHPGETVTALKPLDIAFSTGSFSVIVGANGSGKSTLLNLLAGSLKTDSGNIVFDGTDVTGLREEKRCRWVSRIFQNPLTGTAPELSVLENFRLASLRTRSKKLIIGTNRAFRKKVQEKISFLGLGLENKLDQNMGSLSGGQRQALTLVMAVMDECRILLMDEPTAALDPKTAGILMNMADKIIREFHLTAILVTHHLNDAVKFGNRTIHLREGEIQKDISGKLREALTTAEIYSWFA